MPSNRIFTASLLPVAFLLSACGGGGSSSGDNTPVAEDPVQSNLLDFVDPGIFGATINFTNVTEPASALTFLSPTGRTIVVFAADDITDLQITMLDVEGKFSEAATDIFFNGTEWVQSEGVVRGEVVNRQALKGTAENLSGDPLSSFTLDRLNEISDQGADIARVNRTFVESNGTAGSTDITIGSDGSVNGSAPNDCVITGVITVPDERFNIYEVAFDIERCGPESDLLNDSYTGLASFEQVSGELDVIFTNGRIVGTFFGK